MTERRSLGAHTILYPTPVLIVGSYDAEDRPDVMTVAWGGIVCSKPPSVAVSIRPSRLSHANILLHCAFTVSIPGTEHIREADFIGMASGREVDKFAATGLTAVKAGSVHAPYVGEFPVALECRVTHVIELGAHTQFIGEVVDVTAAPSALDERGKLEVTKLAPAVYIPTLEEYYGLGERLGGAFEIGKGLR